MFLNALILITNFCWGTWGIFDKKAVETSGPSNVLLTQYLLALPELLLLAAYMLLTQKHFSGSYHCIFWAGMASITSTMAMVSYMVAMSKAEASFVLGITAAYPLAMQVLAFLFLHESLDGYRILGSILIGAGVFAIGGSGGSFMIASNARDRRIVIATVILATIGWGVHGLFDKKAVGLAPPLTVMFVRCCFDLLEFLFMFWLAGRLKLERKFDRRRTWILCSSSTFCLMLGYICYLKAMTLASASYVIVITGCYPLLMYIFALIFLKEKVNLYRFLGVLLVVGGGILVQLTQST